MARCGSCSNLLQDPHVRYCPSCGASLLPQAFGSAGRARPPLTAESLTRERNYFLVGFFALVASAIVIRLWVMQASDHETRQHADALLLAEVATKGLFLYLPFRLSRFLRHPAWLTFIYCVLMLLTLLYLIPLVGLLIGVRNARARLGLESLGGPYGIVDKERLDREKATQD